MARPRKKLTKQNTNLTLDRDVKAEATQLGFDLNESLSSMIERLLKDEIARVKYHPKAVPQRQKRERAKRAADAYRKGRKRIMKDAPQATATSADGKA